MALRPAGVKEFWGNQRHVEHCCVGAEAHLASGIPEKSTGLQRLEAPQSRRSPIASIRTSPLAGPYAQTRFHSDYTGKMPGEMIAPADAIDSEVATSRSAARLRKLVLAL
jgi:hypothetical protein